MVMKFIPEGKFEKDRKVVWDKIIKGAYNQACGAYLYGFLPEIMKQILPSPSIKGVPIPWTGAPSGAESESEVKKKIRKHAIDIIMEVLKQKGLHHQFNRAAVEAEYDKRISR